MTTETQGPEGPAHGSPHYVVGLDVFEESNAALDQAFRLALLVPGTRIDVVWAPPIRATPLDGSVRMVEDAPALLKERAQRAVSAFGQDKLRNAGTLINLQVSEGRPATAIAHAAFLSGAHLIIVGAQDKGALERLVVGSVSRRLVQDAPCPVLVVRPRLADAVPQIEGPLPKGVSRTIGLPHRYHEAPRNVQARENMPLLFPVQP